MPPHVLHHDLLPEVLQAPPHCMHPDKLMDADRLGATPDLSKNDIVLAELLPLDSLS